MRPLYGFAFTVFGWLYRRDLARIGTIYTNSLTVRERVRTYLHRDAEVIYPPVDRVLFAVADVPQEYYLSFARLSAIKRVDTIVKAFQKMPDRRLILTYGVNDPQRDQVLSMIRDYPNITAIPSPSDAELVSLIQGSIATIYIPRAEDFGMSPVESMSCGIPVIAVNDGGLRESIIDGETGILLDPEARVDDLVTAVRSLDADRSHAMRPACLRRAEDFSYATFSERVRACMRD